jgi:hypothetical protein
MSEYKVLHRKVNEQNKLIDSILQHYQMQSSKIQVLEAITTKLLDIQPNIEHINEIDLEPGNIQKEYAHAVGNYFVHVPTGSFIHITSIIEGYQLQKQEEENTYTFIHPDKPDVTITTEDPQEVYKLLAAEVRNLSKTTVENPS